LIVLDEQGMHVGIIAKRDSRLDSPRSLVLSFYVLAGCGKSE
jgi:hypothetical protein